MTVIVEYDPDQFESGLSSRSPGDELKTLLSSSFGLEARTMLMPHEFADMVRFTHGDSGHDYDWSDAEMARESVHVGREDLRLVLPDEYLRDDERLRSEAATTADLTEMVATIPGIDLELAACQVESGAEAADASRDDFWRTIQRMYGRPFAEELRDSAAISSNASLLRDHAPARRADNQDSPSL